MSMQQPCAKLNGDSSRRWPISTKRNSSRGVIQLERDKKPAAYENKWPLMKHAILDDVLRRTAPAVKLGIRRESLQKLFHALVSLASR